MANEQNLRSIEIYNASLTKEERSERARQAGIASGEARRKRRTFKEDLLIALSAPGVQDDILSALIRQATQGNKAGDVARAFELLRDTIGEKPSDKLEISGNDGQPISTMDLTSKSTEELRQMLQRGTDVVQT